MKDNRIYRPELLTEAQAKALIDTNNEMREKDNARHEARREAERKEHELAIQNGDEILLNGRLFKTEYLNIKSILTAYNMTKKDLVDRFDIPSRTVDNWVTDSANHRDCPKYVLNMMIEILEKEA